MYTYMYIYIYACICLYIYRIPIPIPVGLELKAQLLGLGPRLGELILGMGELSLCLVELGLS